VASTGVEKQWTLQGRTPKLCRSAQQEKEPALEDMPIKHICDAVEQAHAKIQKDFEHINPVVGVNKQMRSAGIPTDIMMIDCLKTGKRILLVLHDAEPETVHYQFCLRDEDPADQFEHIALESLTVQKLYDWMRDAFSTSN